MPKLVLNGSRLICTKSCLCIDGKKVASTQMERKLLAYLLEHPNTALSREQLLREVWGYEVPGSTRTVDSHIKKLRADLEELRGHISTVRSVGYRLDLETGPAVY